MIESDNNENSLIDTEKTPERIEKTIELFFSFDGISTCQASKKIMEKDKKNKNKILKKLYDCLCKFASIAQNNKITTLCGINYADYKSLKGKGLFNCSYEFDVHDHRVLTNEYLDEENNKLFLYIERFHAKNNTKD